LFVHSPFFPGWRMSLDDRAALPDVQPGSGYMAINVPAGSHHVAATFENTPVRAFANNTTVASLVAWSLLLVWSIWQRFKRRLTH
jgi:hypothetical protein